MSRPTKRLRIRRGYVTDKGTSTFYSAIKVDDGEPVLFKDKEGIAIGSDTSITSSSTVVTNPNNELIFFKSGVENKLIDTSLAYSRTAVIKANTNHNTNVFDLMATEFSTDHIRNENIRVYVDGVKLEESINSDNGGYIIIDVNAGTTNPHGVIQFTQDIPIDVDLVIETIHREQPAFLTEGTTTT